MIMNYYFLLPFFDSFFLFSIFADLHDLFLHNKADLLHLSSPLLPRRRTLLVRPDASASDRQLGARVPSSSRLPRAPRFDLN